MLVVLLVSLKVMKLEILTDEYSVLYLVELSDRLERLTERKLLTMNYSLVQVLARL